jgi:hypothetical protein
MNVTRILYSTAYRLAMSVRTVRSASIEACLISTAGSRKGTQMWCKNVGTYTLNSVGAFSAL